MTYTNVNVFLFYVGGRLQSPYHVCFEAYSWCPNMTKSVEPDVKTTTLIYADKSQLSLLCLCMYCTYSESVESIQ